MWMMPLHLHVNNKSDYDYDVILYETEITAVTQLMSVLSSRYILVLSLNIFNELIFCGLLFHLATFFCLLYLFVSLVLLYT